MIMEYAYFDKRYSECTTFMSLNNWLAIALLQVDYRCDSKTFFFFFLINYYSFKGDNGASYTRWRVSKAYLSIS